MARMRCTTCGGTYQTDQARGTRYFHACPPIDRVTIERDGRTTTVDRADVLESDTVLEETVEPRPDARDENVVVDDYKDDGTAITRPRREGRGTTEVPTAPRTR